MPACCGRCTRPVSASISSPAAAWARSARCSPRSTAAPGCGSRPGSGRAARCGRFYHWRRRCGWRRSRCSRRARCCCSRWCCSRSRSLVGVAGFLLDAGRLRRRPASALTVGVQRRGCERWFSPGALPLIVPRLVLLGVLVVAVGAIVVRPVGAGSCGRGSAPARARRPALAADWQPAARRRGRSRRSRPSSGR